MKDWLKIIISVAIGIIMALIGAYVQLSLNSVHREMDDMKADITRLQVDHKEDIVAIHRRISELHK
jgi:hypothetical protein